MATRKSIRSGRNSARSGRSRTKALSPAPDKRGEKGIAPIADHTSAGEAVRPLIGIALRLKVIHGTAIAAELALRQQNAEQDLEIADCLRSGVCDPIADQASQIHTVVQALGGELPESLL